MTIQTTHHDKNNQSLLLSIHLCTPSPRRAPLPLHGPQRPSQSAVPPKVRPQHECRVPKQPDNVYGDNRHPVEQVKDMEQRSCWHDIVGEPS